jgi:hypothetical protein
LQVYSPFPDVTYIRLKAKWPELRSRQKQKTAMEISVRLDKPKREIVNHQQTQTYKRDVGCPATLSLDRDTKGEKIWVSGECGGHFVENVAAYQ